MLPEKTASVFVFAAKNCIAGLVRRCADGYNDRKESRIGRHKGDTGMVKFGLIGCGNMGGALAKAAAQALPVQELMLANRTPAKAQALAEKLGYVYSHEYVAYEINNY